MAYGKIHGYQTKVVTNNHFRKIIQKRDLTLRERKEFSDGFLCGFRYKGEVIGFHELEVLKEPAFLGHGWEFMVPQSAYSALLVRTNDAGYVVVGHATW